MSKIKHLLIISFTCLLLASFKVADSFFEISKNIEIFTSVYEEVNKSYVDEVQPGTLIKKGIDAMLDGLDPYTNFYSENQAEKALVDRMGEYGGVGKVMDAWGVEMGVRCGWVQVTWSCKSILRAMRQVAKLDGLKLL